MRPSSQTTGGGDCSTTQLGKAFAAVSVAFHAIKATASSPSAALLKEFVTLCMLAMRRDMQFGSVKNLVMVLMVSIIRFAHSVFLSIGAFFHEQIHGVNDSTRLLPRRDLHLHVLSKVW